MFLMQDLEAQSVHSISTTSTDSCRIREVEAQRPPSLAELRAEGDETTTRHPPRDAGFITWKTLCSAVVVQAFLFGSYIVCLDGHGLHPVQASLSPLASFKNISRPTTPCQEAHSRPS